MPKRRIRSGREPEQDLQVTATILRAALKYLKKGFSIIPVHPETKVPLLQTWQPYRTRRAKRHELTSWWATWPEAVPAVICGAISNLVVIDVDHPPDLARLEGLVGELPSTLRAATPRGTHLYFRGTSRSFNLRSRGMSIDIQAEGKYVVLPFGNGRRWLNQKPIADLPEAITALAGERPSVAAASLEVPQEPAPPLSLTRKKLRHHPDVLATLRSGNPAQEGKSRSETDFAVAVAMAKVGFTVGQIASALGRWSEKGIEAGWGYCLRTARQGTLAFMRSPSFGRESRIVVARLERRIACLDWSGKAGRTDRDVFQVLLDTAKRFGRLSIDLSGRDLADAAGITAKTAFKAFSRLTERGLIARGTGTREPTQACKWLLKVEWLLDAEMRNYPTHIAQPTIVQRVCGVDMQHDLWRNGALGKAKRRIYELLRTCGETSVKELARMHGTKPGNVQRHLKELERYGLVAKVDDGRWRAELVDQDQIAEALNAAGVGERQRHQHNAERAAYRARSARDARSRRPRKVQLIDRRTGQVLPFAGVADPVFGNLPNARYIRRLKSRST